jgi:hypothetical protein
MEAYIPTLAPQCWAAVRRIPASFREITLRQRSHHAAGARTSDTQTNGITDCERVPDPCVLHEIFLSSRDLHNNIWTKSPHLETPLWIELS